MAICWLETWLNLPGKSPVLPVARMRCEKGRAWKEQGKNNGEGRAWASASNPRLHQAKNYFWGISRILASNAELV